MLFEYLYFMLFMNRGLVFILSERGFDSFNLVAQVGGAFKIEVGGGELHL